MKYKPQIIYVVTALIIFGVCFYWFEVRPANIRSDCEYFAVDAAENIAMSGDSTQDFFYQQCLHENGL